MTFPVERFVSAWLVVVLAGSRQHFFGRGRLPTHDEGVEGGRSNEKNGRARGEIANSDVERRTVTFAQNPGGARGEHKERGILYREENGGAYMVTPCA
jgi:hypothetical protein